MSLAPVLDALEARGLPNAEVFAKRGRARVIEETPGGVVVSYHREEGWAARAGDDRRSLFATGTGAPDPAGAGGAWPEPDGDALVLPEPPARAQAPSGGRSGGRSDGWREPADLDAPLIGEREAAGLLATVREELRAELPAARLLRARLSDGASEWEIESRLDGASGISGRARGRAALLRLDAALAVGDRGRAATATLELAVREATSFEPRSLARRLADRLSVAARGSAPERDRAVALLAPAVGARLLAALAPLFFADGADRRAEAIEDRDGRFASSAVTVIDDARLDGGVLAAPIDGEGIPTAAATLVEAGIRRPPLVSCRPQRSGRAGRSGAAGRGQRAPRPWGCMRRPSWRDLPHPGPSHLYLAPGVDVGVGGLLRDVARGYYLIDLDGAPRIDFAADRLELPVVGFRVERGSPASPLAGAVLESGLGAFLRRIEVAARDLTFYPLAGGMVGAPTLRVEGVEIRRR